MKRNQALFDQYLDRYFPREDDRASLPTRPWKQNLGGDLACKSIRRLEQRLEKLAASTGGQS